VRIVIAPDDFKDSLSAAQAARAIAHGWGDVAPDDVLDLCPLSDGGPGFVATMQGALGGELLSLTVRGPLSEPVPATIALVQGTAFVESAQACGLHLLATDQRDPTLATTFGVGELITAAIAAGATKVVIGLGGSATNDAGAGMLAALGSTADRPLDTGGLALGSVTRVDLGPALAATASVEIIAATDVDNPLLGLTGATNTYAPQKGADDNAVMALEGAMQSFVEVVGRRSDGKDPAVAVGSGAGGGLGYGLLHLGARRRPGIAMVMQAVGLAERIQNADLVVTGEGCFDWQSIRGKVVTGAAGAAMNAARPCVVIAGDVLVGRREYSAIGVTSAYSIAEIVGSIEASLADPAGSLHQAASRVGRTWSH